MISVIMPVYNCKKYVKDAIYSVLNQTYTNFELIIIDDGSNDGTKKYIQDIEDKRIRYYFKENGGEASARNLGLSKVRGDFIAFIDADDLWRKDKLEIQYNEFKVNDDIDVIYTDIMVIDGDGKELYILESEDVLKNKEDFYATIIYRQVIPATASMMIRSECLNRDLYYPEQYTNSVDYAFTLKLAKKFLFKYINKDSYLYRRHGNNLTNNHCNQVKCEKMIVKNLGVGEIIKAVESTTFNEETKMILLAKIFLKIDKLKEAKEIIKKITNESFEKYFLQGVGNYLMESYEDSLLAFKKCLEIQDNISEVYNNIGCCLKKQRKYTEAKKYFKKALVINSKYIDALRNIENDNKIFFTTRQLRKKITSYI